MDMHGPIDEAKWWEVAKASPEATFFHTPLWADLASAARPDSRAIAYGWSGENGHRAILPVMELASGRTESTFAGCYGGVIATEPTLGGVDTGLVQMAAARSKRAFHLTGNPLGDAQSADLRTAGGEATEDYTHILTLDRPLDEIIAAFRKGHRSSMRKGQRMGVTCRVAGTLQDYREYYGAYQDSLRRWGEDASSEYPWPLFNRCHEHSREYPELIKLWLAEVDGRVIGGALVFYWNGHAVWWHGAAYEEYFDHCPNNVLQAEILADAIDRGYRYYDFNPSGGHEGVSRFKDHFGAVRWPLRRWKFSTSASGILSQLRHAVRRNKD